MSSEAAESDPRVAFLRECYPFSSLPPTVVEQLAGHLTERLVEEGEVLIEEGHPAESLMVIVEGRMTVTSKDEHGQVRDLGSATSKEIIGEMAMLTQELRTANVVAATKGKVWQISAPDFWRLAQSHPLIAVVLTRLLEHRLGHDTYDALGGKDLNGYRVLRCLGTGGMSVVYEAKKVDQEDSVALKMLSHHLTYDLDSSRRFEREAELARSLDHPHVLRVYDYFPSFHTYFIVMEYLHGANLAQVLRRHGPLPEEQVRRTLGQLGEALEHSHGRGVIHRDLKPGNVMLREDGHLKLTDFGIASAAREDPSLTRSGVLVGTPRYMSPEQIQGDPPAPSFDLYALGCIGLELITGKPTFPERDVMKLMLRKATWKIPTQRKLGAPISNELYTVLKSCLAREPEKRQLDFALLKSWSQSVDPALVSNLLKNTDTSADTVDAGNFDDPSSDSFF